MESTRYPLIKKQMIESQSSNGRCYVRLIPLLPSFGNASLMKIEEAITSMTMTLGSNPLGMNVLNELYQVELLLSEKDDSALGLETSVTMPSSFIETLMGNPVRFGFEELGGVFHVTYYMSTPDSSDTDSPIQTEFGWASRFIIQMMCNSGQHIGANQDDDDDLASLFESVMNDRIPMIPKYNPDEKLYSDDATVREAQSKVEDTFNKMERDYNRKKSENERASEQVMNKELLERLTRMEERMQSVLSMKSESQIAPDDSSSNVGRYSKKFLKHGTVFDTIEEDQDEPNCIKNNGNVERYERVARHSQSQMYDVGKSGTILSSQCEQGQPLNYQDVVVGFKQTDKMSKRNNENLKTIHPINGLANPFKSNRLGLLSHFHTAIYNILPKCREQHYIQMVIYMSKYKATTPSEELARQIVTKTFDISELIVISNPFKLPFIEIGMQVNDPTLVKCFSLLKGEYEQLWFNEMKHLWVPDFHDRYRSYREGVLTNELNQRQRSSQHDEKKVRSSSYDDHGDKKYYARPSKKSSNGRSILSLKSIK